MEICMNALKVQSAPTVSLRAAKNEVDASIDVNITERLRKNADEEAKTLRPSFFYTLKGNGGEQFSFDLDANRFDCHDLVAKL